jgi:hypothetical protein
VPRTGTAVNRRESPVFDLMDTPPPHQMISHEAMGEVGEGEREARGSGGVTILSRLSPLGLLFRGVEVRFSVPSWPVYAVSCARPRQHDTV